MGRWLEREQKPADNRHESADAPGAATSPHLHRLLEGGHPSPDSIADLIAEHPEDEDGIMSSVHDLFGNAFAVQVAEAGTKKSSSKKKKKKKKHGEVATDAELAIIDGILAAPPTDMKGYADVLIHGLDLGFFTAADDSDDQIRQFAAGDTVIHSHENGNSSTKQPGVKKRKGKGNYDVTIANDPEVLQTMAAVLWKRLSEWVAAGGGEKRVLLEIGSFVRADVWAKFHRYHAEGRAADFSMSMSSSPDNALALLADLPPGKVADVVPDENDHTHVALVNGEYHFGLPFQGVFFDPDMELGALKRAEIAKAKDDGNADRTVDLEGLRNGRSRLQKSHGELKDGHWTWTPDENAKTSARTKLISKKVKQALDDLEDDGRAAAFADTTDADADGNSGSR